MSKLKQIAGTGLDGLVASRFVELFGDQYDIANASLKNSIDITNKQQLSSFIEDANPVFFIHAAAFTDVNAAYEDRGNKEGTCYAVNVNGTKNVVDLCAEHNIPLIHLSTDYIFDGTKETPYTEEDQPNPIEWYGETKAQAEQSILENGLPATILRIAFPYRAHYATKPDLIAKVKLAIEEKRLYPQFADTLITPTFIDDIAQAINHCLEDFKPGIYHATGSQYLSNFELATLIADKYNLTDFDIKKGSLTDYLKSNDRPFHRFLQMNNNKFSRTYNVKFKTVAAGLTEIIKQQS